MRQFCIVAIAVLFLTACGTMQPTPAPTLLPTVAPTSTTTPIPTATNTSAPIATPTATQVPSVTPLPTRTATPTPTITYVTLGAPFAKDCGDGIPRIWSNDGYNGPWYPNCNDDRHGHVDIWIPVGCNVTERTNEVLAPASGIIQKYAIGEGYHLLLPKGTLIQGTEDALRFSGIPKPDISLITQVRLDFGHVQMIEGTVSKGQPIGEIIPFQNSPRAPVHFKIAYKVGFLYSRQEYAFTPTLFVQDGPKWQCMPDSWYDCEPQPRDYAPTCSALKP